MTVKVASGRVYEVSDDLSAAQDINVVGLIKSFDKGLPPLSEDMFFIDTKEYHRRVQSLLESS